MCKNELRSVFFYNLPWENCPSHFNRTQDYSQQHDYLKKSRIGLKKNAPKYGIWIS